jgi:hypothetical protein
MRRPPLEPASAMLSLTIALDTPPMVVAMLHHERNVRSLAAVCRGAVQGRRKAQQAEWWCWGEKGGGEGVSCSEAGTWGPQGRDFPMCCCCCCCCCHPHGRHSLTHELQQTHQSRTLAPRASAPCAAAAARRQGCGSACQTACPSPLTAWLLCCGAVAFRDWCPLCASSDYRGCVRACSCCC